MVMPCRSIADQLDLTLINMRFVKPLDRDAVLAAARQLRLRLALHHISLHVIRVRHM
jgi:1-deoxy-D-xylulose-5-phosphate synthase